MKRSARLCAAATLLWFVAGCSSDEPDKKTSGSAGKAASAPKDAGKGAAPAAAAGSGGAPGPTMDPNTAVDYPDPRGGCTIDSGYADDHACIAPPDPSEGMQIHVGPSDYKNAEEVARYIIKPGQETSECWTFHTPNDEPIYYQTSTLSGRSGTHHIINTMFKTDIKDGGFTSCADPGTGMSPNILDNLPGASKAYMPRGHVAPENAHVGRMIPAHATAQADMHYYNFTEKDIIREFWMNIYFVKPEQVEQRADQIRGMGGFGWQIAPGTDKVYSYSCPIVGDGRILTLLGHYHAHGKQFTASLKRKSDGEISKVFEMFNYVDPAQFEYDSVAKNPTFADGVAGAVSGMLDVKDGDVLMWDCHIINDSNVTLTYKNEVKTGEMCNLWGSSLGIKPFNCLVSSK